MALDILQQYDKKLEKVNSIIQKIATENKHITPMVSSDYALFDEFFAKEERHTYGNSWIYVTQGTYGIGPEKLGYKYSDGENLCTMAIFPKIEQPDIIMLYWIRPLGPNIIPIIAKLANEIKQKYGICSYVKKLFPDQYEYLLQHGFRSAKEFPWHSSAHSEDDTFPELIFDREKTLDAIENAPRSSSLGRVKRGVAKTINENEIVISDCDFKKNAWRIANEYFLSPKEMPNKINVSTPMDYFNMIFNKPTSRVKRNILFVNQKPMGFYVVEETNKSDIVNVYCTLALRKSHRYLMDYMKCSIFEKQHQKLVNCGGSEDEGLHYFKNKYQPIQELTLHTVVN